MPQFAYHSVDRQGRTTNGSMMAVNERALDSQLRELGLWLIDAKIETARKGRAAKRIPRAELIEFFRGATSLLVAGIPIADTLQAMAEEMEHEGLRQVLDDLSVNVQAGVDVSTGMANYPDVFSDQVRNLVRAGEQSGNLTAVFQDVANHLEWFERLLKDVRQASIYPAMILLAVSGLVALMLTVVVPSFAEVFAELDLALPALTQAVVDTGEAARRFWWLGVLVIAAVFTGPKLARRLHPSLAFRIDRAKLELPIFGPVLRMLVQSQFVHNMAMMLKAGVPILDALALCQGLANNAVMDAAVLQAMQTVERGGRLSEALRGSPVISSLTLRMVIVGEESGRLDTTLQQVADRYDEEIPRQIKRIFSIIEPMITLILVGVVGLIAGSLFLPMFSLMSGING